MQGTRNHTGMNKRSALTLFFYNPAITFLPHTVNWLQYRRCAARKIGQLSLKNAESKHINLMLKGRGEKITSPSTIGPKHYFTENCIIWRPGSEQCFMVVISTLNAHPLSPIVNAGSSCSRNVFNHGMFSNNASSFFCIFTNQSMFINLLFCVSAVQSMYLIPAFILFVVCF